MLDYGVKRHFSWAILIFFDYIELIRLFKLPRPAMQSFWILRIYLLGLLLQVVVAPLALAQEDDPQQKYYSRNLRPILKQHCFSCHNEPDKKGGLNLERYDFIVGIVKDGPVWVKVLDQIRSGAMPPNVKPPIPSSQKEVLLAGIEAILDSALSEPDPGQVVLRRLSNREYQYTIQDLIGVSFDARSFFPADASGGEGFDNQAKVLYITPLLMERYLVAADTIVHRAYRHPEIWNKLAPMSFPSGAYQSARLKLKGFWTREDVWLREAREGAREILVPLATRAFRRPLKTDEKEQIMAVFEEVFLHAPGDHSTRFNTGLKECMKYLLVSPHFLYRRELDRPSNSPYPITNFELASRLSYFLWSSAPDDELLDVAYRSDLHNPDILLGQLKRMLQDPRAIRLAESFAGQWLEVDDLLDSHQVDADLFPGFSPTLRSAMHREAVLFVDHVLTERQNLLDLLDSDYTFLNKSLAEYYGLDEQALALTDAAWDKVTLPDRSRGGVLGLSGVLTVTSLPTRTSPVLRGKWGVGAAVRHSTAAAAS